MLSQEVIQKNFKALNEQLKLQRERADKAESKVKGLENSFVMLQQQLQGLDTKYTILRSQI